MLIEYKVLRAGDETVLANVAEGVFDGPLNPAMTQEFLADPRHHLVVALQQRLVVGFVSGVHYVHPDRSNPELWINEVGVARKYRGFGIGKALLGALFEVGRELNCAEAWVLTDRDNARAMRLYTTTGEQKGVNHQVMFKFAVTPPGSNGFKRAVR